MLRSVLALEVGDVKMENNYENTGISLKEIAEESRKIEDTLGLSIDDVLNKLTQELGEFNDAVQKYRGRYCKSQEDTTEKVVEELGDLIFNLASVCNRLGINSDNFPLYAGNTLKKFYERKDLYMGAKEKREGSGGR